MDSLPIELINHIYEFAGIKNMWKSKFTNNVLPIIDKGVKIVGYDNYGNPCHECYKCSILGGDGSCYSCYYNGRDGMDMTFKDYQLMTDSPIARMCKTLIEYERYNDPHRMANMNSIKISLSIN